jgi:hypothetical protein
LLFGKTVALWGHGNLVLGVRDNLQEKAPFRFSGNDGGKAGVASFEHEGALVETKARLLLFFSVALHTVIRQNGGNVFLVRDLSLRRSRKKEAYQEGKEREAATGSERESHAGHRQIRFIGCGIYATEILTFSGWERIGK